MTLKTLLAGLVLVSTVQMAEAWDPEHYVALSYDFNDGDIFEGGAGMSSDEKDEGYTLTYGYQFEERLAVEVFYTDVGSFSETGENYANNIDVNGYGVGVKFDFMNEDTFKVFGRLGYARHEVDQSLVVMEEASSDSDTDSDYFYGIGAEYVLTPELNIRGEYNQFEVGRSDYNSIKIGFVYGFYSNRRLRYQSNIEGARFRAPFCCYLQWPDMSG